MFLIRSHTERDDETGVPLYWCNTWGWVDRSSATRFTTEERDAGAMLVGRSEWEEA